MNDYSFLSRFYKHVVVNINTIDNKILLYVISATTSIILLMFHIPVGYFNTFQQDELVA